MFGDTNQGKKLNCFVNEPKYSVRRKVVKSGYSFSEKRVCFGLNVDSAFLRAERVSCELFRAHYTER